MPPKAVKTIRDLIYWEYAKLISGSAGFGRKQFPFVMRKFIELKKGNYQVVRYFKRRFKDR